MENQWENVVIPEVYDEQGFRYRSYAGYEHVQNTRHRRSFLIKALTPANNYEARVQARNDHGWNKLSTIFHFTTASEGKSCVSTQSFSFFVRILTLIYPPLPIQKWSHLLNLLSYMVPVS